MEIKIEQTKVKSEFAEYSILFYVDDYKSAKKQYHENFYELIENFAENFGFYGGYAILACGLSWFSDEPIPGYPIL